MVVVQHLRPKPGEVVVFVGLTVSPHVRKPPEIILDFCKLKTILLTTRHKAYSIWHTAFGIWQMANGETHNVGT